MSTRVFNELLIDRRSSQSISDQISSQLESKLLTARLIDGKQIINHIELAEIFKLNENETLEAYKDLEKKGFLDLSSIEKPIFTKHLRKLNLFDRVQFIEKEIKFNNKEASTEIIDFEIVDLEDNDLVALDEFNNNKFLKMVRLYKANQQPYVYLIEYFPVERFPKLLNININNIDEKGNIYKDIFYDEYGIKFDKLQRYLNVINYEGDLANIFNVKEKTSGFKIDLIYYDQNMVPFCYGYAYMSPNIYFDYQPK